MGKFSIQWSNDTTDYKQPMSSRRVMLRRNMRTHEAYQGLACRELYLDQVYIVFRPSNTITASEFVAPDAATFDWHSETDQLMVRIHPGFEYPFHNINGNTNPDHVVTSHNPDQVLAYSTTMCVKESGTKNTDDHYWCRTYRPVRDAPVSGPLLDTSELQIDLLFPILQNSSNNQKTIPNYRILSVLCDFTYND